VKTIKQYVEEFDEAYRQLALDNMAEQWIDGSDPADDAVDALLNAFFFPYTPQGAAYWWDVVSHLEAAGDVQ